MQTSPLSLFNRKAQAWEDSHGKVEKVMKQVMFLPHEILASFSNSGNLHRMTGDKANL